MIEHKNSKISKPKEKVQSYAKAKSSPNKKNALKTGVVKSKNKISKRKAENKAVGSQSGAIKKEIDKQIISSAECKQIAKENEELKAENEQLKAENDEVKNENSKFKEIFKHHNSRETSLKDAKVNFLKEKLDSERSKNLEFIKQLRDKDMELRQKDRELRQKDSKIRQKDSKIRQKDSKIRQKDRELTEKNTKIRQKDKELTEKDKKIQKRNMELMEKDMELRDKDMKLKERNQELSQEDEEFEKFQEETYPFQRKVVLQATDESLARDLQEAGINLPSKTRFSASNTPK